AEAVLQLVQVLDQEVAAARRLAEQRAHLGQRGRVDGAALGLAAHAAAAAQLREIDDGVGGGGSGWWHRGRQSRKSQCLSTWAARSSECCRTRRSASSVSRFSSASMIRMWSSIDRDARSDCEIVIRRIARTCRNRFSIVLPIRCEPDRPMIAWWKAMFASEYSLMCSAGVDVRNSSNIRRSEPISASEAFTVASRAAMLSTA